MNRIIYCTVEQTRMALELGAPIFPIKSRRTKETVISSDDVISYDEDFYTYVTNPTAEEMIGWKSKTYLLSLPGYLACMHIDLWNYMILEKRIFIYKIKIINLAKKQHWQLLMQHWII